MMEEKRKDDENPIVIYTSQDGQVHVNVRIEGETAWLTQAAMAQLFGWWLPIPYTMNAEMERVEFDLRHVVELK